MKNPSTLIPDSRVSQKLLEEVQRLLSAYPIDRVRAALNLLGGNSNPREGTLLGASLGLNTSEAPDASWVQKGIRPMWGGNFY